jgi:hypothetical protein
MFGLFRRHQPGNVLLAVLYWALVFVVAMVALFAVFTMAERLLPGAGQF